MILSFVPRIRDFVKVSRLIWTASCADGNVLLNHVDGREMKFPYVWLRDNCRCKICYNEPANSRVIPIHQFNFESAPKEAFVNDNKLKITWTDNHSSSFLLTWLKDKQFTEHAQTIWKKEYYQRNKSYWTAKDFPNILNKFSFNDIFQSDLILLNWLECLAEFGVALVSSAGSSYGRIGELAEKIAFLKRTQYGNVFRVEEKPGTTNVAYLSGPLYLHTDLPYYSYKPGVNLLHCVVQSTEGGDNQIADSFSIVEAMKKNHHNEYKILRDTNVVWSDKCCEDSKHYHSINVAPVICESSDGEVERVNFSQPQRDSQFNVTVDEVHKWYKALRTFSELLYSPEFNVTHKMEEGDILTFDNLRIVHGRTEYKGKRCVEGGYVDWDHIYSRIRVLQNKHK